LTLNVSTITTGCFQNDKGVICQCQSKSLGNKEGC
jgi:hypothetical protein